MDELKQWLAAKGHDINALDADAIAKHMGEFQSEKAQELEAAKNAAKDAESKATSALDVANATKDMVKELGEKMADGLEAVAKAKSSVRVGQPVDDIYEQLSAKRDVLKDAKNEKAYLENGGKLEINGGGLVSKAAGNMSISGNVTGEIPAAYRVPGLNDLAQVDPRFIGTFNGTTGVSSNLIKWDYELNEDGGAGQTSEGTAKTQQDFDLATGSEEVVKTTSYFTVTTEMLDDIDYMRAKIDSKLRLKVIQNVSAQSYSGDGVDPNHNGVRTVATTFAKPANFNLVDNANEVDVLSASMVQILNANQPLPNYIFVDVAFAYNLQSIKVSTTDRRYVDRLTQVGGTMFYNGIPIIGSNEVAAGEFLVGNSTLQDLYERQAYRTIIGLNADDLTNNRVTMVGEWRGATVVETNDRPAFIKGDWTTAKGLITV